VLKDLLPAGVQFQKGVLKVKSSKVYFVDLNQPHVCGDLKYVDFYFGKGILDSKTLLKHRPEWFESKDGEMVQVKGNGLEMYLEVFKNQPGVTVEEVTAEFAEEFRTKMNQDEDYRLRVNGMAGKADQIKRQKAREEAETKVETKEVEVEPETEENREPLPHEKAAAEEPEPEPEPEPEERPKKGKNKK